MHTSNIDFSEYWKNNLETTVQLGLQYFYKAQIFSVLAICSILVGCAHTTGHETHGYGKQVPTTHNVPEREVTVKVPVIIPCPEEVLAAFAKSGLTLKGVVSIFEENGTIGVCSPENLRPLRPGEIKTLNINNESIDQVTITRGSHCITVNGITSC